MGGVLFPPPSFGRRRVCVVDWWSAVDDAAIPVAASLYLAAERPATKDPERERDDAGPYATVLSETPWYWMILMWNVFSSNNNVALSSSPRCREDKVVPFSAAAWYDVVTRPSPRCSFSLLLLRIMMMMKKITKIE